jgi:hypothetical protein
MKRRIGIISLPIVPDDPRVRKQGDLLANAGWGAVAIGLSGHRSYLPDWRCVAVDENLAITADAQADCRSPVSALRTPLNEADGQAAPRVAAYLKVAKQAVLLTIKDPAVALWMAPAAAARLSREEHGCAARGLLRAASSILAPGSEFNWKKEGRLLLKACDRALATANRAAVDLSSQLAY